MKNSVIAPALLIAAMLSLVLFRRVLFGYAVYEPGYSGAGYIIYNGGRYLPERFFILAFTSYVFAFVIPVLFYIKLFKSEGYTKELYFRLPGIRNAALAVYGAGALICGAAFFGSLAYYTGGPRAAVIDAGGNPVYDISAVVAFVLLPAVCEEIMFRSVMAREYEQYGALPACLVSSAAFAMLRFSFAALPAYFTAGVILYILAKISGSILPSIIAHAAYNFFSLYIWGRLSNVLRFEQNRLVFMFVVGAFFIIFIAALVNKAEHIYYKKAYANEPAPERLPGKPPARFRAVFLSPVFLAALILYFIIAATAQI